MKNKVVAGVAVIACALTVGCGGGSASTTPNPVPQPTAVPAPTPTPTPAAIACGLPTPPPLYSFRVKVGNDQGYKKVLDSRVMVKGEEYCSALGYPGSICVVRDEHAEDAITCGNFLTGVASQTGRYGPNWYWNDKPCRPAGDPGDGPGCKQHPTNQFFVFAFGPGTYSACGDNDRVCFGIEIQ